jgi:hypothetical protein
MSIKLTDTQLMMLSAAAQRNDRYLIAVPNLKVAAAQKIASKLIGAGLVREIRAKAGAPVWRRDEDAELSYALRLTAAGVNAVADDKSLEPGRIDDDGDLRENLALARSSSEELSAPDLSSAGENGAAPQRSSLPRGGTKLAQVVELLQQDRGASIAELIVLTGWLPHTTRAALTGLRKRGFVTAIDRSDKERGSIYRVERSPSVEDSAAPPTPTYRRSTASRSRRRCAARRNPKRDERRDGDAATLGRRGRGIASVDAATGQRRVGRGRDRGPRRSRCEGASAAVAQPFGRNPSRPFAAVAAPESLGLSVPGRRTRRSR